MEKGPLLHRDVGSATYGEATTTTGGYHVNRRGRDHRAAALALAGLTTLMAATAIVARVRGLDGGGRLAFNSERCATVSGKAECQTSSACAWRASISTCIVVDDEAATTTRSKKTKVSSADDGDGAADDDAERKGAGSSSATDDDGGDDDDATCASQTSRAAWCIPVP